jgi:hypothetical protein
MYATPTKRRTPIWQLYSVRSTVCDFANHEDEERIFFQSAAAAATTTKQNGVSIEFISR